MQDHSGDSVAIVYNLCPAPPPPPHPLSLFPVSNKPYGFRVDDKHQVY